MSRAITIINDRALFRTAPDFIGGIPIWCQIESEPEPEPAPTAKASVRGWFFYETLSAALPLASPGIVPTNAKWDDVIAPVLRAVAPLNLVRLPRPSLLPDSLPGGCVTQVVNW